MRSNSETFNPTFDRVNHRIAMAARSNSTKFTCTTVHERNSYSHGFAQHVSLAYGQLAAMPQQIINAIAPRIQFLDLTCNSFRDLSFLTHFPELQTLVLDRNCNLDCSTLPTMEHLRILWLNNCNLINISNWLKQLQTHCPNLRHLSMMCNPVGPTVLNGVTAAEEREYRKWVIQMLPQLSHFDGVAVAGLVQTQAHKLAPLENVVGRVGHSMRQLTQRLRKNVKSMDGLSDPFLSFSSKHATSS